MVLRLLILLALLGAGWLVWKRLTAGQPRKPDTPDAFQRMVQCETCGLHLPASEAITDANKHHYCCQDHAGKSR